MAAAATSASTSTAVTAPTNPDTQITNLKKDIQKLSDELRSKNDLLNSLLDLAHQQSMHIASLKAAVEDTVHWDPDTSPRPSSSSTPKPLWSEVVCVTPTPACSPAATGLLTSAARSRGRGDPPGSFVMGTSMVRHVRVNGSRTFCHPGAFVRDITNSAHQLSLRNPSTHTIIVHAGVNDLKFQQSETLKKDFITLIHSIKQLDKQCIISGPLPSPRFGDIKFSRLRQLHIWLKGHCLSNNIPYVDNFTTFFNRPNLFKPDGIHPNQTGSQLLSMNIELTLRSAKLLSD
uniref:SGNH hydrolase-type esterase domain-containing protein n=1 Tax=Oryzias sinensis TaxID=183150 RepID=A0A8C7ZHE4_9TELE